MKTQDQLDAFFAYEAKLEEQAEIGVLKMARNLGAIEEQILSDGSKVYNVHVPAQTVYCRTQLSAINFVSELSEAIRTAQGA